ncbi:MAG: 50S ribosomal protein L4 [Bacteroides sp.]|nr:50S ribosomal protein L4 [Bacillota bacterium]MCM1393964.1 50S ribosomal protein L4 [[Eubacterium] siraeum]MCM1455677.1 50S ribosomal protein L4 [Bacteroides sp.]
MELNVLNMAGQKVGSVEVSESVFACDYNEALVHQVVVAQLANKRQGTMSTLTRTEVRGGGAKPYRQKGTGRARQGSIVSPQYVGGGVVFAKKPRDFSQKINKSMKKTAFLSAISEKIRQNEVVVLDKLALAEAKTKHVANTVEALGVKGKVLFVLGEYDADVLLAARNIPAVGVTEARTLSVYDIVANKNIVLTVDAIKKIEEAVK